MASAARSSSAGSLRRRAMRHGDEVGVVALMESTIVLGKPVHGADLAAYVRACFAPYAGRRRRDAAVVVDSDQRIVGYALVCTDPSAGERDARWASVRLGVAIVRLWLTGRLSPATRRFYVARLRDVRGLLGSSGERAMLPHAHVNVEAGRRSGTAALLLLEHVDQRVAAAGYTRWIGEVNAPTGRRVAALERLGFTVVGRTPNNTLSRLTGSPVERLTLHRDVAPL